MENNTPYIFDWVDTSHKCEDSLPDWDDDSPIIASDTGNYPCVIWELTEKGTMKWRVDETVEGYNPNLQNIFEVGLNDNLHFSYNYQHPEYHRIRNKIKQIYIPDYMKKIVLGYLPNCERILIPESIISFCLAGIGIKEDFTVPEYIGNNFRFYMCHAIEKITLPSTVTTLKSYSIDNMYGLKEINLENIKVFEAHSIQEVWNLEIDMVFSAELESIKNNCFGYCAFKSVTFQQPTGDHPVINSTALSKMLRMTKLSVYEGWNQSLYAPLSPLTQESLHDCIEKFADMSMSDTTMVFHIGPANIEKIDAEHIAMLDAKCISYS